MGNSSSSLARASDSLSKVSSCPSGPLTSCQACGSLSSSCTCSLNILGPSWSCGGYAALSAIFGRCPALAARVTSMSRLNLSYLPRTRSETRCCVTEIVSSRHLLFRPDRALQFLASTTRRKERANDQIQRHRRIVRFHLGDARLARPHALGEVDLRQAAFLS